MSIEPEPVADLTVRVRAARLVELAQTDYGMAERLVQAHGRDLRYVPGQGWLVWDGMRFRRDDDGAVMRRTKATVREVREAAARMPKGDARDALWKFANRFEAAPRLLAAITLAESEEAVLARVEQLDADAFLLNTENGTLDLRTGELRPHDRADLITRLAPVAFDADATAPTFDRFLADVVPDPDVREFVQRAAGYTLSADTSEQCLFLLHGQGANGKTTLVELLADMLGDYAAHAAASTFMDGRARTVRSDLARLPGARLVVTSEVEDGCRFAEALVKLVTGGDKIVAAQLYQSEIEFAPDFKLWMTVNSLPEVRSGGDAIWRRLRRIPFEQRILHPDRTLPERLRRELPGVLAWAVRGCTAWHDARGLAEPAQVIDATDDYRSAMDTVATFVADCCVPSPGANVKASELFDAYTSWCERGGARPVSTTRFGTDAGALLTRHRGSSGVYYDDVQVRS